MDIKDNLNEFLVISRGHWDKDKSPEEIQAAIDQFYAWIEQEINAGRMRAGQRLSSLGKVVQKQGVTDDPYTETREIIGGYWFIMAESLEEAANLASRNPCLECGLLYEIRPIENALASAYQKTSETPK
ncbi:YciI family protein [Hahella ganghwensis]|uniref:YciI family protein n=1 Tax=Hahella ganghwensis TaxID=286420 RepID=UPI00039FE126|nr:YciI family protein [Hahella ganghwensis]